MNDNLRISSDWTLHNVTLTAICHRGKVFNERGLNLTIHEGRHEQLHPPDEWEEGEPLREVWDYQFNFYVVDAQEPDNSSQDEATIAMIGELPDGRRLKVHGNGYIGRDDLGQIEGSFFSPPRIEMAEADEDFIDWDRPD